MVVALDDELEAFEVTLPNGDNPMFVLIVQAMKEKTDAAGSKLWAQSLSGGGAEGLRSKEI